MIQCMCCHQLTLDVSRSPRTTLAQRDISVLQKSESIQIVDEIMDNFQLTRNFISIIFGGMKFYFYYD